MDQLQRSLLKRWREQRLGHFYILNCGGNLPDQERRSLLTNWVDELLLEITIAENGVSPTGAARGMKGGLSDLVKIDRGKDSGKNYRIEELKELLTFHHYRPFEWRTKFAIINDTHLITDIIFNKLLKMLEGEAGNGTVLFLNWNGISFPATIRSRAISLTVTPSLPANSKSDSREKSEQLFERYLAGELSESQLIGKLKLSPARQQEVIMQIIEQKLQSPNNFQDHQSFFKLLAHIEQCSKFHNIAASRLFQLLKSC